MSHVSMIDIARATGLSKNSVSVALKGTRGVSLATRARVIAVAQRLGYRPNPTVAHLMAQIRASRTEKWKAKLALINAHKDADALRSHPTIPTYVAGCEQQAARLGYSFDRFWLHDPEMRAEALVRVLQTRSIAGIVVVGLMDTNQLPVAFKSVWAKFPSVVTGVRTRDPALSFCCVDHHNLALTAFERALALGYQRPGLVLDDRIDTLVERRFSAGFYAGQRQLRAAGCVPVFGDFEGTHGPTKQFEVWLRRWRPDVVFTLYNVVFDWLRAVRLRVPRDIGVIQLEWRRNRPEVAGMNQHNDVVGRAAVDMVVSQIHNGETGIQEFPRATLVGATWVDGATVRRSSSREAQLV